MQGGHTHVTPCDQTSTPLQQVLQTVRYQKATTSTPFHNYRGNCNNTKKPYLWNVTPHQIYPEFANATCRRRITTNAKIVRDVCCTHQQQSRNMAFITGHASTKRKNKKKRAAKAIESNQRAMKKKVMTDEEYKKYQQDMKLQRREKMSKKNSKQKNASARKKPAFDPSTTPNYPLGPNGLTDMIENEDGTTTIVTPEERAAAAAAANENKKAVAPPAVLLPTGSPHVFVAKVACQELDIDPRTQLFASSNMYLRHDTKIRTAYTFEPYGPLFAMASSVNHSKSKNHHSLAMSEKPEVAFLGRSNVGKSSLVNALMNKTLAVTSKQPGRTQQAYYYGWIPSHIKASFQPKDGALHSSISTSTTSSHNTNIPIAAVNGFLVDLPGYGFAVGPDAAVETWQVATQDYLRQRRDTETLKRVFILQDARLQSPQPVDGDVLRWLEDEQIPHTVVLTKADDHHTIMNKSSSTAGVIKHANICCFRYYQLWSESGATLPGDDENESHPQNHENNNEEDAAVSEDEAEEKFQEDKSNTDEWYDEKDDEDDSIRETEDEDEEEEDMVGTIMLSPVVHVTSAKKLTGLAELLSSIESEFASEPIE